ncbi:MAG TPA: SAM-dependent methyltransferase [Candidatus Eisenbacteria bacterium]|nr:SAM-dependent methyltransferase [Candidatus Eisenbacteria bacterium]
MTPLATLLAERIRRFGPITFAEYMRECLYHPLHGYYSRPEARRYLDYFTSVDVGPIFGRLLARQFAEMWELLGRPAEFLLVEGAAGTGRLAAHILEFCETRLPELFGALTYIAVERSPARCEQLSARLSGFIEAGKCRARLEIPRHIAAGCVFSNELLDALPVHRVVQQDSALRELFVTRQGESFTELSTPLSTCAIADYFAAQQITLKEGQIAEAGLETCDWITEVARRLGRGFVVTIDYGHEAAELFDEHHMAGTVLSYARHQASDDLYSAPGEQDLSAHVNFTALQQWGARQGLQPLGVVSQTSFLLALGKGNDFADLYDEGMDEAARARARLQLKTLIYPEGMGERFQVLVQQKGVAATQLTCFTQL